MNSFDLYEHAFATERGRRYPAIDEYLRRHALHELGEDRLLAAAKRLACPIKPNPPCWQHGRLVYALARSALAKRGGHASILVDIGTAKGFSALCAQWAIDDSASFGRVMSCDVIDPRARVKRNTIAEVEQKKLLTLDEILWPWPEAQAISFYCCGGEMLIAMLSTSKIKIRFAFIDGKHTFHHVNTEIAMIAKRQEKGDIILVDDIHFPSVRRAFDAASASYDLEALAAVPGRREYGIAVRR